VPPLRSTGRWLLEVMSPLPGLAEKFKLEEGTVFSEFAQGHLKCGGSGLAELPYGGTENVVFGVDSWFKYGAR
jgi:hypothetical protein